LIGFWVAQIFFIRLLSRTLALTRRHHPTSPENAWALLIPLFNCFWIFYIVQRVAQGVKGRY
jgi:hypothetical protein